MGISVPAFPIREFTALTASLFYVFYDIGGAVLCSLLFVVSVFIYFIHLDCLLPLAFIFLMAFMFLSAALSFSFVLFSAVLNFTYFIPLGCLPLLALFSLYSLCFCPWCCLLALFYSPLSLILLILSPWDVSFPLLLFTLFSAPSAVCRPPFSATPLSFCAFPSPP